VNSENATRIGVARENLARASATGGISFNTKRMKMNDPAQIRMIVVKKIKEVNLRLVDESSPLIHFSLDLRLRPGINATAFITDAPNHIITDQ